jgi:hypothetical protein
MCVGAKPSKPEPVQRFEAPKQPEAPQEQGGGPDRRRAGFGSTILTSPLGASGTASTTGKTLLGA